MLSSKSALAISINRNCSARPKTENDAPIHAASSQYPHFPPQACVV